MSLILGDLDDSSSLENGVALGTYGGGDALRLYTRLLSAKVSTSRQSNKYRIISERAFRIAKKWQSAYMR